MTLTIQKFGPEGAMTVALALVHGDERIVVEFSMSQWSALVAHGKVIVQDSQVKGNEKGGPQRAA